MQPLPVSRKINRERIVLIGWGRAILLQLAHPLIAAAVADYSGFRQGARGYLRRVRRTVGAMLAICFGTPEESRQVIAGINAVHDRVHGRLAEAAGPFPSGTRYSAGDPELLLWVHATLVDSLLLTYEALVAPLTEDEKTQYLVESAAVARELGVPADRLPMSAPALRAYMTERYASGEIHVSDAARTLARALLSPPLGPMAAPVFRLSRLLTMGLLPAHVRAGYGYRWDASQSRRFTRLAGLLRQMRRLLPAVVREWPAARAA